MDLALDRIDKSNHLSVVIQGPILEFTKDCISSVRTFLPKSEIIISTWDTENFDDLDFNKLILLKDPGPTKMNTKRQIINTFAGVRVASKEYVLKMRSDLIFYGNDFLDHINKWNNRNQDFKVFKERLIVPNMGTADPDKHICFQVSDFAILGLKEDLLYLFDISPEGSETTEKSSEQYIYLSAIQKKYPNINIDHIDHKTDKTRLETTQFMTNNIIVLNTREQFNFISGRHKDVPDDEPVTMTHNKWKEWYSSITETTNV